MALTSDQQQLQNNANIPAGQAGSPWTASTTPTATVQPTTPTAPTSPAQQALATAQASGPAPQDAGTARSAVANFMPNAAPPVFYKPTIPLPGHDPQTVYDASGKALSYDQYIAAGGKPDFSNVQAGSPPPPTSNASTNVPANPPTTPPNTSLLNSPAVEQQLANDPGYQQLLADRAEYTNVANQQKSLTDTYTQLTTQLGIPALNTQLMNMKTIMDGTENDIRSEVTKAGGFATESQVLALTSARNKQLIQNYNNLLQTKQQAQDTLNTMIGLAGQDRTFALSSINQKLQIDQQISDYQQKMTDNAKAAYQNIVDKVGYQGLAQMTNGDPYYTSLVEKTLDLPAGGLQQLSTVTSQQENAKAIQSAGITTPYVNKAGEIQNSKTGYAYTSEADFKEKTGMTIQEAQSKGLVTPLGSTAKTDTQIVTANGKTLLINSKTGEVIKDLGSAYKGSSGGGGGENPKASPLPSNKAPSTEQIKNFLLVNKNANPGVSYYDLWGQLADDLKSQNLNPSNYDKQFWEILHPEGLAGYNKYVTNKKSSSREP